MTTSVDGAAADVELGMPQLPARKTMNLYEELRTPIGAAFLMFLVADVREMAQNNELSGDPELIQKLVEFPLDGYEFISLYRQNKDVILKRIDSQERYEMYSSFFQIPEDCDEKTAEIMLRSMSMLHFEDSNSEKECVYAIGINHLLKRVTLAFRGSVTPKDFEKDAKALFAPIRNPVTIPEEGKHKIDPSLSLRIYDTVLVHLGFREYLYGDTSVFKMPEFIKKVGKASHEHFEATRKAIEEEFEATRMASVNVAKTASDSLVPEAVKRVSKSTATTASRAYVGASKVLSGAAKKASGHFSSSVSKDDKSTKDINITEETTSDEGAETKGEKTDGDGAEAETKKKYQVILDQLAEVLKQNEGYELYICGHSLGGALATLLCFEASAADDDLIPKPVTCVTTGAPKVGNLSFLHSFEALEEQKKVRYLRVANFRDIVPLSPPNGAYNCLGALFCQPQRFRHVGLRLKLYPHGYMIGYPPKMRRWPGIFCCDMIKIIRHWVYLIVVCPIVCFCKNRYTYQAFRSEHTQLVYMHRFDQCQHVLEKMTLDDLFQERIERACWRRPLLHGSTHVFVEDEYKKKPYKSFSAILEV